jgi:hypothetical protein
MPPKKNVKPKKVKPAAVKPAAVKPAAVKPAAVKPAAVKPAAVKPAVQRTPMVVNIQQQPGGFKQAIVGGFGAGAGFAIGNGAFAALFE